MKMPSFIAVLLLALMAVNSGQTVSAKSSSKKTPPPVAEPAAEKPSEAAEDELPDEAQDALAEMKHETGPKLITLGDGLELDLTSWIRDDRSF